MLSEIIERKGRSISPELISTENFKKVLDSVNEELITEYIENQTHQLDRYEDMESDNIDKHTGYKS